MGVDASIVWGFGKDVRSVFLKISKSSNATGLLKAMESLNIRSLMLLASPATLQEVCDISTGSEQLARLTSRVFTGGAPLSEAAGNKLVYSGVKLVNLYGA